MRRCLSRVEVRSLLVDASTQTWLDWRNRAPCLHGYQRSDFHPARSCCAIVTPLRAPLALSGRVQVEIVRNTPGAGLFRSFGDAFRCSSSACPSRSCKLRSRMPRSPPKQARQCLLAWTLWHSSTNSFSCMISVNG